MGQRERFGKKRRGSGNVVPRLPQILPAKVAAAEFALILAMMTGAVVAAPFRVAVIDMCIEPSSSGVLKLLVSNGAKRHAPLHFARPLVF